MIQRTELFVGGEWQRPLTSTRLIEVRNPASSDLVGTAPESGNDDVDLAVDRARAAFEAGEWAGQSIEARIELIQRMSRELEPKLSEILELVTSEMGIPIRLSRSLHREMALASVDHACEAARQVSIETEHRGKIRALLRLEPVGVVASIAPWNGPFVQALYKTVYPLLAGCSVVFKPSPETPLDAFFVAEALQAAGLPEGVLSVLPGGREVGDHLVRHPEVDAVFFTGSTATGQHIGGICGTEMKRAVLELGGKSAAILLEDADLDQALGFLANGAFGNSGQNCAATSRILAPEALVPELAERLAESARALTVGDPSDEGTDLGPLISEAQLRKVESFVDEAVAAGANLVTGGKRASGLDSGWFYEPTVLTGVSNSDRVSQEEIFGPVACVIPYRTEAEAIRMANDSPYGLHGSVFSADEARALDVARAVRAGTYSVNSFMLNSECPYGGYKMSGVGRKYGVEGLREFLEVKTINFASTGTFSFTE